MIISFRFWDANQGSVISRCIFFFIHVSDLSWKLKWAFVIVCCPTSVHPSVRNLFTFLSSSSEPVGHFQSNLIQNILKRWGTSALKWRATHHPFSRSDNSEIVKIHCQHFKIIFSRTYWPFQPNLAQHILEWWEIKFVQIESHNLFQGDMIVKISYDVIQGYLLCLYHLGQLERLVGDTRSAKFHIKEGWTTAHFMGLPKWYKFLKQ